MALNWKVISQRNWLKGLQATYSRFSQPQGIFTRMSNLLYDQRGGLRLSDGSDAFCSLFNAPASKTLGPIPEFILYSPASVSPYYVGLRKNNLTTSQGIGQLAPPTVLAATPITVGGTINNVTVGANGVATVTLSAPHNLPSASQMTFQGLLVQSGNSNPDFNASIQASGITVTSPTTYTYQTGFAPGTTGTGGTVTTTLANGTYQYEVTSSDGQGGETLPTAAASATTSGGANAIQITWVNNPLASGYDVWRTSGGSSNGQINAAGPQPGFLAQSGYVDIGGTAFNVPVPAQNTTQTLLAQIFTSPTYGISASEGEILAVFPSYFAPPLGGIPGTTSISSLASPGKGASPQGGVVGFTGPLPQMVQFANKVIFALGNGYQPQQYLDELSSQANTATYTPSSSFPVSGGSSASGSGSSTGYSTAISGFPSQSVSGQQVTLTVTGSGTISETDGTASIMFQISIDGGSTWQNDWFASGNFYNQQIQLGIPSGLSNLDTLQVRIATSAEVYGEFGGNASASAVISACTATVGTSVTPGALTPLQNNYSGEYTDWEASVTFQEGAIIVDSVTNGMFQATITGVTGATRPDFNNTVGAQTPEISPGTEVWLCTAVSATGTPLRGAACAIVYSGSLWLANTYPTTTSDLLDGPCCIKMSQANNPSAWDPSNTAFLNQDDGDQITCMASYTIAESGIPPEGSLIIFKNFSTFQITGVFGATNFAIQQAQTDMGSIAGKSVQFISGYGVMRLSHLGFAYFMGVRDMLVSEPVRPYLFGGQPDILPVDWNWAWNSKGAQAANPPMYVCACPIVTPLLSGVTITSLGHEWSLFVRVVQLVEDSAGNWVEVACTPETQVYYDEEPEVQVNTPIGVEGVKYRVFVGFLAGGENLYFEASSFLNSVLTIVGGTYTAVPGFSSFSNGGLTRVFCYDLIQKSWAVIDVPFPISGLRQIRTPGAVPVTVAAGAEDGELRRMFGGDLDWDTGEAVTWNLTLGEVFQEGASAKMFYRRVVLRGSGNLGGAVNLTVNISGQNMTTQTLTPHLLGGNQWELRADVMADGENANLNLSGSGNVSQLAIESLDWYVKPKSQGAPVTIQR
jgi:hypothetical protein